MFDIIRKNNPVVQKDRRGIIHDRLASSARKRGPRSRIDERYGTFVCQAYRRESYRTIPQYFW